MLDPQPEPEYHSYRLRANWIDLIHFLSDATVMYLPENIMLVTNQHLHQIEGDCDCDTYFEFSCNWNYNRMRDFCVEHQHENIRDSLVYCGLNAE